MDRLFFDLRATHNPHRWHMPVTGEVCVGKPGHEFLFGGVGLAASIGAMERTCGRPLVWATAQYLSYARPPSVVDLDVWTPAQGRYNTQARVIGHVNDQEIFTVVGALGARPSEVSRQWVTAPACLPPEDCEPADYWRDIAAGVHGRFDVRVVKGAYGSWDPHPEPDGRTLLWLRPKEGFPIDAAMLAIMADFVPPAVGVALGVAAGGNSLDNTLRIRRLAPTDWVLCDIRIQAVDGGFAHGAMLMFAQDGELMASGGQSLILRVRRTKDDR